MSFTMKLVLLVFALLWSGSLQSSSPSSASSSASSTASSSSSGSGGTSSASSSASSSSSSSSGSGGCKKPCGGPPKCGENEVYSQNKPLCPPQTCASIYSSYNCENVTKSAPGCKCKDGYLRNGDNGPCILSENCPPPTPACGGNETYVINSTRCEYDCNNATALTPSCPVFTGCQCNEGYVRNSNFECIKQSDCPPETQCGVNEYYNDCYSACETTCKTRFRSDGRVCPAVCLKGCSCNEGYLRHDNGTCVPTNECSPPKCNDDEVYQQCGTACPTDCSSYNNTCLFCIALCVEGCFCKEGTIRSAPPGDLSCISPDKCPKRTCGKNQVFEWCPPQCPSQNCTSIWTRENCSNASDCCEPQCRCKQGYYRNKSNLCVSKQECLKNRGKC